MIVRGLNTISRGRTLQTYVLPPDTQWPRHTLPAWPPYTQPVATGSLVHVRGRSSDWRSGVARVISADESGGLLVAPVHGARAGQSYATTRRKAEQMHGRGEQAATLLVADTNSFRTLARSQLLPTDVALEIGCSHGHATQVLCARCVRACRSTHFTVSVHVSLFLSR